MWVWGILALFDTWQISLIPFGTFIIMNYVFYRFTIFQAMDSEESTPGTVYFASTITLLYALFWRTDGQPDRAVIATGGVANSCRPEARSHTLAPSEPPAVARRVPSLLMAIPFIPFGWAGRV